MPLPCIVDSTTSTPALQLGINAGNLDRLPAHSTVPRLASGAVDLAAVAAAGFGCWQGPLADAKLMGVPAYCGGRVNNVGEIDGMVVAWKSEGYAAATLHVGWGHEDDHQCDRLIGDILAAEARHAFPLFVETHRATITQDTWRTVQLVKRHPDLRFNADYSHWYTGLEMVYGDFNAKLDFLEPVFARVGFLHGRIGTSGQMQACWDDPGMTTAIGHFRMMWTRTFRAFRRRAAPDEVLPFCCELLFQGINYQPRFPLGDGHWVEAGDRWAEALRMAEVVRTCWAASATSAR